MKKEKIDLSIISPVFQAEEIIDELIIRIEKELYKLDKVYEIILVDDGSLDSSWFKIKENSEKNKKIKGIKLSKNFGQAYAISAGLKECRGECSIVIDCDLQDPIELLPNFLEYYKEGYDLVYGIREKRKESFFNQLLRKLYYKLVRRFSKSDLPLNAGDFMLVGRKSLDALSKISYENIYVRGELHALGVKKKGIKYSRKARKEGKSKFRLFSINILSLAKDGFFSQSNLPLRLSVYFFIAFFIFSILGISTYFFLKIIGMEFPEGYISLVLFILLSIAINSLFFGIIGEYILRIYSMLKSETECIVQDKVINDKKSNDSY